MKDSLVSRITKFIKKRYAPRGSYQSFTNTGEDLLIEQGLLSFGITKPLYIDIGCHHPIFNNITYLFYKKGGHGILIEPDKELCEISKRKRPRDTCIQGGVGKNDTEALFYKFERNTRSTFSRDQAEAWKESSSQSYTIKYVNLLSLNTLITQYLNGKTPDLISIDTEGYEEEILSGFDWKVRPKIFCVESAGRREKIQQIFENQMYSVYAQTLANTIFIDSCK